jgi:hypothetical protein
MHPITILSNANSDVKFFSRDQVLYIITCASWNQKKLIGACGKLCCSDRMCYVRDIISPTFICENCNNLDGKATGYFVTSNFLTPLYVRHLSIYIHTYIYICIYILKYTCVGVKREGASFYIRINSLFRPSLLTK